MERGEERRREKKTVEERKSGGNETGGEWRSEDSRGVKGRGEERRERLLKR